MVIKNKYEIPVQDDDKKRNNFIEKGGHVSGDKKEKGEFSNVLFRIPTAILERVDESVKKKPWMTRTQWIMEALHDKLDVEDNAYL